MFVHPDSCEKQSFVERFCLRRGSYDSINTVFIYSNLRGDLGLWLTRTMQESFSPMMATS
ncbi:hypothetical protein [Stenotrophomonas phage vB_SmeS_BUCT709]|nr:hypothetical protein [Stenotrophomonas phage vB_SmeS_BUCT709]